MLRVLHCIYDDPGNPWVAGGGAVRVFEIYRLLARRLASITVATGRYPGAREGVVEGVRYLRLGSGRGYAWSRLSYSIAASRLLARRDFDAAVFDFSTYTPLRLPKGAPVGVTVHHLTGESATERWGWPLGPLVEAQERRRLRGVRRFSATSEATLVLLRDMVGPEPEIRLIQAGVPDELFDLPRRETGHLLYFGRLDWFQKGLDVLLGALAILARADPGIRLKVAGRGKDAARLAAEAEALGVRGNVEILGPVGDAERNTLLSGASVLLMPSRFEGFGMVAAEAMAAGVPVVAAAAGSLPEVVAPPEGGVLVPPGDAGALAEAVARLLADPRRRAELSLTARASAERFRWNRIAQQHLAFLESIHTGGAAAPGTGMK
jgi:glycosyltransferase involved in cell wall biosynthesis